MATYPCKSFDFCRDGGPKFLQFGLGLSGSGGRVTGESCGRTMCLLSHRVDLYGDGVKVCKWLVELAGLYFDLTGSETCFPGREPD